MERPKQYYQEKISEANIAYRKGEEIMSDYEYDLLVDEYINKFGEDIFISQIGYIEENDRRMRKLPIIMGSMNKIKTIEQYKLWLKSKNIPAGTVLVLTPKYDAISLCVDEEFFDAWTRGDGVKGQYSNEHFKLVINENGGKSRPLYSYGEAICRRDVFQENFADIYANPRNMVSGLFGDEIPKADFVSKLDYIRYGVEYKDGSKLSKQKQLSICNIINTVEVPYHVCTVEDITIELMTELFFKWSVDYEIDGIIIDIDDVTLRESLGRETSKPNPCYARAFKGDFEEVRDTKINDITYEVSKNGNLCPVGQVDPVNCNGAMVSNVTLYNAKYIMSSGIHIGAIVKIKRSGMVIPKIVQVFPTMSPSLPAVCPVCGSKVEWDDTTTHLHCTNVDCPAVLVKRIYMFFETIEADSFGRGMMDIFIQGGYNDIKTILNMNTYEMQLLDRMGEKKAQNIYNGIHSKLKNIELPKLQHASGYFSGLGSKKLALIEKTFGDLKEQQNLTIEQIITIDGFSDKSAQVFLNGISKFIDWVEDLPCTIKKYEKPVVVEGGKFAGQKFVFTGYRDDDAERYIRLNGGEVMNGVSKKCTHLIMKEKGSGSGKEQKAIDLGLVIYDRHEFDAIMSEE